MEPILRNITPKDWVTIIIFVSVLFLVIAKTLFYGRFLNYLILPFNNKYIFMYNKKDKLQNWFHVFFTIFFIINTSLFIYLARNIFLDRSGMAYPFSYLLVLGALVLYILVKITLQLGNGFVFSTQRTITEIIFKKLSYLNYCGLIMLFANIFLTYVWEDSKAIIYISILLILLINIIGWVTLIRNHQKFITSYFFYFILYLCALEIAPVIIMGNYLKG
ncbi:DUF4271 domain-containing protein [Costertonia aggregata]|uniref:DUF4271 domain-containing protein n=1 Tax=Costertonia aggregata TaxID=343403 RepID=A0A7H9AQH7_9FLAO|nr:DUF4271 domain-containing protein [Costertonia aggregata]QLG45683.1 DUF4271 domain-containing protein [Costertonia aggregata]